MVNKYKLLFLTLGIGMGIILTNFIYYANPSIEYIEYSEEDIISEAKNLGMVFVKDNIDIKSNKEKSKKIESKEKKFAVEPGDTLDKISEKLYQLELIDNANNFRQYSKAMGVEKELIVGTYIISSDYDYEKIIKILMKR